MQSPGLGLAIAATIILVMYGLYNAVWRLSMRQIGRDIGRNQRAHAGRRLQFLKSVELAATPVQRYSLSLVLTTHYLRTQRFAECEAECRKLLANKLTSAFEIDIRTTLSEALFALGRLEEARVEKARAAELNKARGKGFEALKAEAELFEREGRFAEAYDSFHEALALAPTGKEFERSGCLFKLAATAGESGRHELAVDWARQAIDGGVQGPRLAATLSIQAANYIHLNRLTEAENCARRRLEVTESLKRPDLDAESVATLGMAASLAGRLSESLSLYDRAVALAPTNSRLANIARSQCLRVMGRSAEARAALEVAATMAPNRIPHLERRGQAIIRMHLSTLSASAGDHQGAARLLADVYEDRADDTSHVLRCDAVRAWILARAERPDEARRLIDSVNSALQKGGNTNADLRHHHHCLGNAATLIGDLDESRRQWERYLAACPSPPWHCIAYYELGEIAARSGDAAEAIRLYTLGADPASEFEAARKCSEALGALPEPRAIYAS